MEKEYGKWFKCSEQTPGKGEIVIGQHHFYGPLFVRWNGVHFKAPNTKCYGGHPIDIEYWQYYRRFTDEQITN